MKRTLALGLLMLLSGTLAASDGQPLPVSVSILPQKTFVDAVGGDAVDVQVLVRPGESPATHTVTPRQMSRFARSNVYFRIGVPFENGFADRLARQVPTVRVVDLREGIDLLPLPDYHHHDHDKDKPGHDHGKEAKDPHIWLDPVRVNRMVETIRDELIRQDPDNAEDYRKRAKDYQQRLQTANKELQKQLAAFRGQPMYVFHPAFGYFADRYGLKQIALEIGGKEPSPKEIRQLMERASQDHPKAVFIQPEFPQSAARQISRALDAEIVTLDPLSPDYLPNLHAMAEKITRHLKKD